MLERAGRGRPAEPRSPTGRRREVCPDGELPAWPAHRRAGDHAAEPHGVPLGLVKVAELLEQSPQRGVRTSLVGPLLNGLAEASLGIVELAQLLKNVTENGQREGGIGAKSDGLAAMRQGLLRLAQFEQDLAQVAPASTETGSSCTALRKCSIAGLCLPAAARRWPGCCERRRSQAGAGSPRGSG